MLHGFLAQRQRDLGCSARHWLLQRVSGRKSLRRRESLQPQLFAQLTLRCVCRPSMPPHQWPFQEPKLEVPTIYKAYVREYPHKKLSSMAGSHPRAIQGPTAAEVSSSGMMTCSARSCLPAGCRKGGAAFMVSQQPLGHERPRKVPERVAIFGTKKPGFFIEIKLWSTSATIP